MLSVASTRTGPKSSAIIAALGAICGLKEFVQVPFDSPHIERRGGTLIKRCRLREKGLDRRCKR